MEKFFSTRGLPGDDVIEKKTQSRINDHVTDDCTKNEKGNYNKQTSGGYEGQIIYDIFFNVYQYIIFLMGVIRNN